MGKTKGPDEVTLFHKILIGLGMVIVAIASYVFRSELNQLLAAGMSYLEENQELKRMEAVLRGMLKQERKSKEIFDSGVNPPRIVVGYGACKDIFVDSKSILDNAGLIPEKGKHFDEIKTENELYGLFAYFFSHGAAAERFVSNDDVFDGLVAKAEKQPEFREHIGGNAPIMANRFAKEGGQVLLGARMTEDMKDNLHHRVMLAEDDQPYEKDDVHLIMEYKRGQSWGGHTSPRANRLILHSDIANPTVSSLEILSHAVLKSAFYSNPNLFVVSGLQMMDNFPFKKGQRLERLGLVKKELAKLNPEKTRVHFEMASIVDPGLFEELTQEVIPYTDSLGMNEQELPNLLSMLKNKKISYVSDSNPRVAVVLDQIRELFQVLNTNSKKEGSRRPLTRVHVHTLAYQAIVVKTDSPWKHTRLAAVKASLTANRHVCNSQTIDLNKAFMLMDDSFSTSAAKTGDNIQRVVFDEAKPVACWTEEELGLDICVAPNLVCSEAVQTAGGGDNISAAGLVLQVAA